MFARTLARGARVSAGRQLSFSSGAQRPAAWRQRLLPAALAVGASGLAICLLRQQQQQRQQLIAAPAVAAATSSNVQPTVYSETKDHALYLTIHLNSRADKNAAAKVAASLQQLVDKVSPPDLRDESDEVWAGVGFGYAFCRDVLGGSGADFSYPHRRGALGDLPSTGGDIFVHAKSNQISKLFELCQAVVAALPPGSVRSFEDVYSFVYRNGRDLSGFIDGTENPADEDSRRCVAVAKNGGSYVITQKWVHDLDKIQRSKESDLESYVGRSLPDSSELHRKSISSHVARMTGGSDFEQKKKFEIVRQSMPYGSVSGEAGLFFIAYAASPDNFNYMLDRMVGKGDDSHSDDVMRITRCVQGNYWYFPSVPELAKLK